MDVDCQPGRQAAADQAQRATQLSQAMHLQHQCGAACRVQHLFGNTWRCESSSMIHVCDANCDHRVWDGRFQTRCLLSGRVFPVAEAPELRKRGCCGSQEDCDVKRLRAPLGDMCAGEDSMVA